MKKTHRPPLLTSHTSHPSAGLGGAHLGYERPREMGVGVGSRIYPQNQH